MTFVETATACCDIAKSSTNRVDLHQSRAPYAILTFKEDHFFEAVHINFALVHVISRLVQQRNFLTFMRMKCELQMSPKAADFYGRATICRLMTADARTR